GQSHEATRAREAKVALLNPEPSVRARKRRGTGLSCGPKRAFGGGQKTRSLGELDRLNSPDSQGLGSRVRCYHKGRHESGRATVLQPVDPHAAYKATAG